MDDGTQDICRVCRSEGSQERPLFYPCVCTGSIKYIHQDCLVQWLRYSRKEYCELCNHRFSFTPIYAPDMPKRLPIKDVLSGLLKSIGTAVWFWLHYTLVAVAWLGIVPLSACRIHRSLFTGSVNSILALPFDLLSTEHLITDIFYGCVVVLCTLCVFISLVWLREHIMHGGGPDWLDPHQEEEILDPEPEVVEDENRGQAGVEGNNGRQVNNNDEINWNPIDWDRANEELTWERLLGLDGSLVFLEHVFWVVSLNTLFILVFEFCPYHIGHFTLIGLKLQESVKIPHFEGFLTTLCGYLVVGISLVLLHGIASLFKLNKSKKVLGLCYVVVKVCLLSVVEIGIFPLTCGWWLDICSLSLFDATLKDREASFSKAPGTTMFMHWLFGMIYVFYFASFVLLLREILRPGVLWFLRNLNDPEFNPIQEMIHLPIIRHVRRFLLSMILFGTMVLLMIWLPIRIIKRFFPKFLPFTFVFTTEQAHELSLELVILQVMMPALMEQGHSRDWVKKIVRAWCLTMAYILDLRSYLIGDVNIEEQNEADQPLNNNMQPRVMLERIELDPGIPDLQGQDFDEDYEDYEGEEEGEEEEDEGIVEEGPAQEPPEVPAEVGAGQGRVVGGPADGVAAAAGGLGFVIGGGLGAAHQALLFRDGPVGNNPYKKPRFFPIKILALILAMCASLTIVSIAIIYIPVSLGRLVMSFWLTNTDEPVHELYTTASGLYVTWLGIRAIILIGTWLPRGWRTIWSTTKKWSATVGKTAVALFLLLGLIPYLCGLLFELTLIAPLRIPLTQSRIYVMSENWVMGTLYIKIACATMMMSPPNFWLRRALERIYNDGLRNINLNYIIRELAAPCIQWLGLALAIPYVISQSIAPLFVPNMDTRNLIERRIYPIFLLAAVTIGVIYFQIRQFRKLYEHIKNDKYLVGRRLVNYERPLPSAVMVPSLLPPPDEPGDHVD